MPDDLRWNCVIIEIKCTVNVMHLHALSHSETTCLPHPWKNCLPQNWSLVPQMLVTIGLNGTVPGCKTQNISGNILSSQDRLNLKGLI